MLSSTSGPGWSSSSAAVVRRSRTADVRRTRRPFGCPESRLTCGPPRERDRRRGRGRYRRQRRCRRRRCMPPASQSSAAVGSSLPVSNSAGSGGVHSRGPYSALFYSGVLSAGRGPTGVVRPGSPSPNRRRDPPGMPPQWCRPRFHVPVGNVFSGCCSDSGSSWAAAVSTASSTVAGAIVSSAVGGFEASSASKRPVSVLGHRLPPGPLSPSGIRRGSSRCRHRSAVSPGRRSVGGSRRRCRVGWVGVLLSGRVDSHHPGQLGPESATGSARRIAGRRLGSRRVSRRLVSRETAGSGSVDSGIGSSDFEAGSVADQRSRRVSR